MPPLPNVPSVVKLSLVFSDTINADIVTRLHVRYSGSAPSDAEAAEFAGNVASAFSTDGAGAMSAALSLIRVEAIDLTTPTSAVADVSVAVPGSLTGTQLPVQTAFVTSYVIARRYRGGHPRGYWPFGVAEKLLNPQTWLTAFADDIGSGMTDFRTAVRAGGWTGAGSLDFVNVSYYHGFTVVTSPTTGRARNVPTVRSTPLIDTVTTFVPRTRLGTQRRRAQYA